MVSYQLSIWTKCLSHTAVKIWSDKDFGVMNLTFWGHLMSWLQYMVYYRWSFETVPLFHRVAEILCVKDLAEHWHWNCIDPHFCSFGAKWGVTTFFNFRHLATSDTHHLSYQPPPTTDPQATLLQHSDLPIDNALWEWKLGQIVEEIVGFCPLTKALYFLHPKWLCRISSKSDTNCCHIGMTTDRF